MAMELASLQTKVSSLGEFKTQALFNTSTMESRIQSQEDRIQSLSASLRNYKLVRGRFISTYKRDVLKTATDADRDIIPGGNMWAHNGGAIVDAELYDGPGGRQDVSAYRKLYGFDPLGVLSVVSCLPSINPNTE